MPLENNTCDIRYFTPTKEVPICGHATLAAAYCLYHEHIIENHQTITFCCRAGTIKAHKTYDSIVIDLPAIKGNALPLDTHALQLTQLPSHQALYTANQTLVVHCKNDTDIEAYIPNLTYLASLPYDIIILTALNSSRKSDIISRVFAPKAGINEDPVTGIAHCVMAPYWHDLLQKETFSAYQASKRGGYLAVTLNKNDVSIKGHARLMMIGELLDCYNH